MGHSRRRAPRRSRGTRDPLICANVAAFRPSIRRMTGMRGVLLALASLLLVGCGGGDGGEASGAEETTSAASEAPAEPEFVEVDECRAAVERGDALASEMETMVVDDASQFTQLFERVQTVQKDADSWCSDAVYSPFAEGVYSLALANAGYTTCEFVELCDKAKIEKDLMKGTGLIHEAATEAVRTE